MENGHYAFVHCTITMSLQNLQLLFRFCNVSGLFPFRLELDEQTGRFKRLVGHWRHPVNWWFILLLIGQVYNIILINYQTWISLTDGHHSYSFLVVLIIALNYGNYLIMILIPRLVLFRIRHLEAALHHLARIDHILTRIIRIRFSCTSRQRTVTGFFISFVYIVSENFKK